MSRAPEHITVSPAGLWPHPDSVSHSCPAVLVEIGLEFIFYHRSLPDASFGIYDDRPAIGNLRIMEYPELEVTHEDPRKTKR